MCSLVSFLQAVIEDVEDVGESMRLGVPLRLMLSLLLLSPLLMQVLRVGILLLKH